jgi:hypothetical protein
MTNFAVCAEGVANDPQDPAMIPLEFCQDSTEKGSTDDTRISRFQSHLGKFRKTVIYF